jgi:hypothetical protein
LFSSHHLPVITSESPETNDMNTNQDPIELMEQWHANECLGMLDRLMLGIPPEGGHVNKETMERMLATAFLTGAICQQDRPLPKNHEPNNTMTTDQLINQLAADGGAIVTSGECSEMEIADAQATGRFYVREDGIGFVRRYSEWLRRQSDREKFCKSFEEECIQLRQRLAEVERDKACLIEKSEKLVRWVESPRHTHEEVRDHNGRLKDTKIWVQFYIEVRGIQRKDAPLDTVDERADGKPDGQEENAKGMPPAESPTK